MSYKLLQVSNLSALGVIGGNYGGAVATTTYPLYKNDLFLSTIGTQTGNLSTAKVTVEQLTQAIYYDGNTTAPWLSADIGATRRVYSPVRVGIGGNSWSSEYPYATLTVLGGISASEGLSAAPTRAGFRNVFMGNVGIGTNSFGTSETYMLNVAGNAKLTGNLEVGGNTTVTGNLVVGGNIDGGDATADTFTITALIDSDIVPDTDSSRDIGTSAKRWALGYFDTIHLTDDLELADNSELRLGDGDDFRLVHNGTSSFVDNYTGNLYIRNNVDDDDGGDIYIQAKAGENSVSMADDGGVSIYYDSAVKLETVTGGIDVTGDVLCDSLNVDGASQLDGTLTVGVDDTGYDVKFFGATSGSFMLWDQSVDSLLLTDSTAIKIGDSQDLQLYHNGTDSYITNRVGELKIAVENSGIAVTIGHTTSETTINDNLNVTGETTLATHLNMGDGDIIKLGDSADLELKHSGSHGYITNSTGDLHITDTNGDIYIQAKTGENSIICYDDAGVLLLYDNSTKLQTRTDGVLIDGELESTTLDVNGAGDISGALALGSTLTVTGTTTLNGHIILGSNASDNITFNGDVVGDVTPNADSSYNLGSTGLRWTKLWVDAIQTTGNVDVDGTLNVQGETTLQTHLNLGDDDYIKLGAGSDLQLYHDGSNSYITNTTGSLYVGDAGGDIYIRAKTGENSIYCNNDGAVSLYYDNANKLNTKSDGVDVIGELQSDTLDVDGAGDISGALALGSTLTVTGTTTLNGHVVLGSDASDNITFNGDVVNSITPNADSSYDVGSTGLRWSKLWVDQIQTTSNVDVDGTLNVAGETTLQTHLNMGDGDIIKLGASADLQVYHDGSHSYIQDLVGAGALKIKSNDTRLEDADGNNIIKATSTAAELYFSGSKKLETVTGGITVTGDVTSSDQFINTVSTGTAPLVVSSTTQVSNLNASFLGGEPLWAAGNNWDVVPYTNSSGASKLGKSIQFFNEDATADGSAQVTLDTGGGSTDLYINGNGSGTGDRVYNTSDFTWQEKAVAHAWCRFSEHSNGTVTNHASYNVSGITNELTSRYQVRYTNAAGDVNPSTFAQYDPGYLISTGGGIYANPHPVLGNPASADAPYDGYTRATAIRVRAIQGSSGAAHDGDLHLQYQGDRLHELAGSNVIAICVVTFAN